MHEMPTIDVRPDLWGIVRNILKKHVPQHEVWAFGSRVKWTAKESSDLDLAIITEKPLSFSTSAALREDFSESDLPWWVDFLDWATTGESFREVVARDKVVVQTAEQWPTMTSEWCKTLLGEVFEVNPSRLLKRGSIAPFIPMEALPQHARSVDRIAVREYTGSGMRFRNGDTLVARITPCLENGKTAFVSGLPGNQIAHGSTEYIVLSGKQGETDSLFAYYLARTPEFRQYAINHMEGTSGRQRVSASTIKQYPVDLPPLAEQHAIAHILGTLDDRIDNLRQSNTTLEAMAQALFKSWFVDFDGVPPEEMQKSELGLIPKGWRVEEIGKLVQCVGGATPSTKDESFWSLDAHHWATPKDLSKLQAPVLTITERRITDAGVARISSGLLPAGTLLMSSRAPIGYLAISAVPVAINQGFIAMLPGGALSPTWLLFWAKLNMEVIKQKANGSTFMEISKTAFRPIKVAKPSPDDLARFDKVAESFLDRIMHNEHQIETLAQLRDTLLPRLISGKLRIDGLIHES